MATTIPIIFSLAPIPTGQSLDANQYGQLLVANLQASITANFLLGQTGGSTPTTNVGPWFNAGQWWTWNPTLSEYQPLSTFPIYSSVINANMQIWQRNTTFPSIGAQTVYTADRWVTTSTLVSGTATVSQNVLNLPGTSVYPDTQMSLRVTVVNPQTTIGSSESFSVNQKIERTFSRPLFDNETSLSIVLQDSVGGTYCVSLTNGDNSWSYVMECAISTPSVPQYFTFPSIAAFPTSTGNWGTANTDQCYSIRICSTCGSNFQDLPNIWNSENQLATTNQTNLFETAGNTLDITLVQHEPSPVSNAFKFVPFDEDLMRCHRYWVKSIPMGTYSTEFILTTTGTTGSSGSVLTFASIIGPGIGTVTPGMFVFGTNIAAATTVTSVTPTTVTISPVTAGAVALGAVIFFVGGATVFGELAFISVSATQAWGVSRFPVKMRISPTVAVFPVVQGEAGAAYSNAQGANIGGVTVGAISENGFDLLTTTSAWTTPANAIRFHYIANSEL